MGIDKHLKFEMTDLYDKLMKIKDEYNENYRLRNEPIEDILMNLKEKYIRIRFKTYAYLIFHFEKAYIIKWFRLKNEKFIEDGCISYTSASDVIKEMRNRIFSGFSPKRGEPWYQYGLPKELKKRYRKRTEGH